MKNSYPIIFIILYYGCRAHSIKTFDYCYTRRDSILLISAENKDTFYASGFDPELSPDGRRVAYTEYADGGLRRIMILDPQTRDTMVVDPACTNCYGPVWSPDAKTIIYNAFIDGHWYILMRGLDQKDSSLNLSRGLNDKGEAYSPEWSADGRTIVVQDMKNVILLDPAGKVMERIPISRLCSDCSASSRIKFLLNKDESKIIFDMELNDTTAQDEPPSAIFIYDRHTGKTSRLSAKGYDCFHPYVEEDRVFFTGRDEADPSYGNEAAEPHFNIYSVGMDGRDFKLEFKNGNDFSCKRM